MVYVPEVSSVFARVLAEEDLSFEVQPNVPTAYFDMENRVLVLPEWDISDDLNRMLIGHEVSHARYTPLDKWVEAVKAKPENEQAIFKGIVNVVEDARIDSMIQRRYPGLKRDYITGIRELLERDFFGLSEKDVNDLTLVDRLNVHFKCRPVGGYKGGIKFETDESPYLDRIQNAMTFDEVLKISEELFEVTKQNGDMDKLEKMNQNTLMRKITIGEDGKAYDEDGNEISPEELQKLLDGAQVFSTMKAEKATLDRLRQKSDRKNEYYYLHDNKTRSMVVPFENVVRRRSSRDAVGRVRAQSRKIVNFMAADFERKKRAKELARVQESKTGQLDMLKLHNYRFEDDLFKRVAYTQDGKNHGFIMVVDCSSSMTDVFPQVIEQTYNTVMFCRRIGVPFAVLGFSDNIRKVEGLCQERFGLIEFFDTSMRQVDIDKRVNSLMNMELDLRGTPLSSAINGVKTVVEEFRAKYQMDIMNVIFLTDGGCNQGHHYDVYVDKKSRSQYKVAPNIFGRYDHTAALYKMLRHRTHSNVFCYFIMDDAGYYLSGSDLSTYNKDGFILKEECGGTTGTFFINQSLFNNVKSYGEEEAEADRGKSAEEIERNMIKTASKASKHRVLVRRIVDLISKDGSYDNVG